MPSHLKREPQNTFRGLNNVTDEMRLTKGWLTRADNINITPTQAVERMNGFTRASTNFAITGAYATRDFSRLYLVDAGELRRMNVDMTYTVLRTGLSAAKMHFTEVNGVVYFANGIDFGIIDNIGAQPWGIAPPAAPLAAASTGGQLAAGFYQVTCTLTDARGMESGNGDVHVMVIAAAGGRIALSAIPQVAGYTTNVYATACNGTVFFLLASSAGVSATFFSVAQLGEELPFWGLSGPRGVIPAIYDGSIYLAEPFPEFDQTVIWCTLPLHYHHFNFSKEAPITVPGTVRMLRETRGSPNFLIIGTERAIYSWNGDELVQEADYGVVPGWHASQINGGLYFWSTRNLCRAMPFRNLTEKTISVAPGVSAGAMVIEDDGARRYVVALQAGGEAFNRSHL